MPIPYSFLMLTCGKIIRTSTVLQINCECVLIKDTYNAYNMTIWMKTSLHVNHYLHVLSFMFKNLNWLKPNKHKMRNEGPGILLYMEADEMKSEFL